VATPTVVAQGFGRPRGLAPIAGGNLFVTDRVVEVVETLAVADGGVAFVAGATGVAGFQDGTGTGAQFNFPLGAATLADGSVLVADRDNNRIRRVDSVGGVTTFAGDGAPGVNDGPKLSAEFNAPCDVAVDAAGNVYVSDSGNHRIRRIRVDGNVDTLAGDGTAGFNDGPGQGAEFYGQEGIDVTSDGTIVYLADGNSGDGSNYNRVRAIAVP
jgi:NHL repeat